MRRIGDNPVSVPKIPKKRKTIKVTRPRDPELVALAKQNNLNDYLICKLSKGEFSLPVLVKAYIKDGFKSKKLETLPETIYDALDGMMEEGTISSKEGNSSQIYFLTSKE